MDYTYDLSPLYDGFGDDFLQDLSSFEQTLNAYKEFVEESCLSYDRFEEKLKRLLEFNATIHEKARLLMAFINLIRAVDTSNMESAQYQAKIYQLLGEVTVASTKADKYIGLAPELDQAIESETFKEFSFYLSEIKESTKHLLSEQEEYLVSQLRQSGSLEWSNLQSLLTSKVDIEINIRGEKKIITASQVARYLTSPIRRTESYFEGMLQSYAKSKMWRSQAALKASDSSKPVDSNPR